MKTQTFHVSNFGSFAPDCPTDSQGYVTIHKSDRYSKATDGQLQQWLDSRYSLVRNAAATEIAERKLQQWRDGN